MLLINVFNCYFYFYFLFSDNSSVTHTHTLSLSSHFKPSLDGTDRYYEYLHRSWVGGARSHDLLLKRETNRVESCRSSVAEYLGFLKGLKFLNFDEDVIKFLVYGRIYFLGEKISVYCKVL